MEEIEKVIARNVNKLLNEKNISKKRLAEIAGVSESTVGKWTSAIASPRMGAVQKISDYFNIPKKYILEEGEVNYIKTNEYYYLPTSISAGLPLDVEAITDSEKIKIPDSLMGKWAGDKNIFFSRVNGDSMNQIMPDQSLIAIKPIEKETLKNGDIVVFSDSNEYSVKYFYKTSDKLIFKPASHNEEHHEQHFDINDGVEIHGKVVLYIVELD